MSEKSPGEQQSGIDKSYFSFEFKRLLVDTGNKLSALMVQTEESIASLTGQFESIEDDAHLEEIALQLAEKKRHLSLLRAQNELSVFIHATQEIVKNPKFPKDIGESIRRTLMSLQLGYSKLEQFTGLSTTEIENVLKQTPTEYLGNILKSYEESTLLLVGLLDQVLPEEDIQAIVESKEMFVKYIGGGLVQE